MFPIICKIGPFAIYSYGLMLALAVILCAFLLNRDCSRQGIPSSIVYDFVFVVVVSGIIGARIFYILLNLNFFIQNPAEIIMLQHGGLAWQGGLMAGTLAGLIFLRRKKQPILLFVDLTAPYIALGQSIGRVGCFLNGCCFGREVAWGIYFPVHHARLHPTQLYTMAGLFILFFILRHYRKIVKTPGDVFVLYLFGASLLRFVIEFFRADHYVLVLGLSVYQWVCIVLLTTAVYVHLRLKSRTRT